MSQLWTIHALTDGAVVYAAFATPSAGSHPKDNGFAWDGATMKATRIDAAPDQSSQKWSGAAWIDDVAKIEAHLIASIKAEAERRKMLVMTTGGAKRTEYAEKAGEVRLFHSLAGTVNAAVAALGLMTAERRAVLFPWATADAAAFGDTLQAAIERFKTGMATSASAPAIAAAEAKACAAIKAATGVAAKRAAAAPAWPS